MPPFKVKSYARKQKQGRDIIPANLAISELDLLASICRDSYIDFVKTFWPVIIAEELEWNWHMSYLCRILQNLVEGVIAGEPAPYDLIVNVSPGTSKSTIFSICLVGWAWTKMPSFRIINSSHSFPLSLDLSRKARDIVESELYQAMYPHIKLRKDQNAKHYFANNHGGMRYSTSTGGSVIGMHGHLINSDDPLDPNDTDSLTEAGLKEANRFQTETLPSRKVNKKTSVMTMVMQRLAVNDPTGYRLSLSKKKAPVKHICLPADCREFPEVKPPKLKKFYKNGLMDPKRLPRNILEATHAILGNYGYAGQFGQQPTPRSGGMFNVTKVKILKAPPAIKPFRTMRFWDKAGTEQGSGARTAGVKMSDYGPSHVPRFIIEDVNKFRKDSAEREEEIELTAELDGKNVEIGLEQEPGSGGKESAQNTVRRLAGYSVRVDRPTGDKTLRADPFSVQVNAGNVGLIKGDWNHDYIEEMRFYGPLAKWKDQIDASAGCFNELFRPRAVIGAIKPKQDEKKRKLNKADMDTIRERVKKLTNR